MQRHYATMRSIDQSIVALFKNKGWVSTPWSSKVVEFSRYAPCEGVVWIIISGEGFGRDRHFVSEFTVFYSLKVVQCIAQKQLAEYVDIGVVEQ
jgi:hypothetical protein